MDVITLRKAERNDETFLRELSKAAMMTYVVQTYGSWDEQFQDDYFQNNFNSQEVQIIQLDGIDVGKYCVIREETEIFLEDIEILPAYQGRGIGSYLVTELLATAKSERVPVRLQVFKVNPALRLYERFGFSVVGETDSHFVMRFNV